MTLSSVSQFSLDSATSCDWCKLLKRSGSIASMESWAQYVEYYNRNLPHRGCRHASLEDDILSMSASKQDGQTVEAKAQLELRKVRMEQRERAVGFTASHLTMTLTVLQ